MIVIHRRNLIIGFKDRFLKQYERYTGNVITNSEGPVPIEKRRAQVKALRVKTCSVEDIDALGFRDWIEDKCDECGERFEMLIEFEKGYDDSGSRVCLGCLQKAVGFLKKTFPTR